MTLKGLPEGVEAVEIRVPEPGEPILVDGRILPAGRIDMPRLVVRILPGYELSFSIETNQWLVVRLISAPPKTLRATFLAGNDADERAIRNYTARAPGFVGITEDQTEAV